jgi:hypothetical protein
MSSCMLNLRCGAGGPTSLRCSVYAYCGGLLMQHLGSVCPKSCLLLFV